VTVHNFQSSLRQSHEDTELPIWKEAFARLFPGFQALLWHNEDGEHQRAGCDCSVILQNSKQVLLDVKVRYSPYTDILLERWSNLEAQVPGWVVKPLRADFIAYAVLPLGKLYLLPVLPLQAAWRANEEEWMRIGKLIDAPNGGYVTRSWALDPDTIFRAMSVTSFEPVDCSSTEVVGTGPPLDLDLAALRKKTA
jgi:hypothetical protein